MSKSLARVRAAADQLGLPIDILTLDASTRSAVEAATVVACDVDQIAKSIIFRGATSGAALLFLTAGGQRVNETRAANLAAEEILRADADFIRQTTGFAIGGVAPIGHITAPRAWMDRRLTEFDTIWAAAGTPNTMFSVPPQSLLTATGAQLSDFT